MLSDDSVDSPTYDGDIESSTTVGRDREPSPVQSHSAVTSTLPSPAPVVQTLPAAAAVIQSHSTASSSDAEIEPARVIVYSGPSMAAPEPALIHDAAQAFNPSTLSPEDIQAFVRSEINAGLHRKYKINEPPVGRPVRVYADGTCLLLSRRLSFANLAYPSTRCIRPLSLWVGFDKFHLSDPGRMLSSISATHYSFDKPSCHSRTYT